MDADEANLRILAFEHVIGFLRADLRLDDEILVVWDDLHQGLTGRYDATDGEDRQADNFSSCRRANLGTVELTFQKEFPRFMSYVPEDRY